MTGREGDDGSTRDGRSAVAHFRQCAARSGRAVATAAGGIRRAGDHGGRPRRVHQRSREHPLLRAGGVGLRGTALCDGLSGRGWSFVEFVSDLRHTGVPILVSQPIQDATAMRGTTVDE